MGHTLGWSPVSVSCACTYLYPDDHSTNHYLLWSLVLYRGGNISYVSINPLLRILFRPLFVLVLHQTRLSSLPSRLVWNRLDFVPTTDFVQELRHPIWNDFAVEQKRLSTSQQWWLTLFLAHVLLQISHQEKKTEYVLPLKNVAIGALNKLEANSFFDSLSAATSLLKYFAMCASNVLLVTSLPNRPNATCSTRQKTTD